MVLLVGIPAHIALCSEESADAVLQLGYMRTGDSARGADGLALEHAWDRPPVCTAQGFGDVFLPPAEDTVSKKIEG